MTTELLAEKLLEGIRDVEYFDSDGYDEPEEDVRTGGHFFEVDDADGVTYTVLVVRTGG